MRRDTFAHKQHGKDVELVERRVEDHPVLAWYVERACPRDDCRHHIIEDFEIDHDIEPSIDVEAKLDQLLEGIELPVIHTYHRAGGMDEGRKAFQTMEQARAYIYGRYGEGNRSPGPGQIRKTYSRSSGSHTQHTRKMNHPMVFAIVNTETGKVRSSNLVPRDSDLPDSAPHWRKSVMYHLRHHLNPAEYVVQSRVGEHEHFVPDWYENDALAWYVEQVKHWEIVIQTPELLLPDEDHERAIELVDEYTPPAQPAVGTSR
jgi:hypothetical protein